MGQSQSQYVINNRWERITTPEDKIYTIVRDKSGREGQQYEISLPPSLKFQQQFAIYSMRKGLSNQLVQVYGSEFMNPPGWCNSIPTLRVITQHVCIRFDQSFSLNLQEIVYVLTQALKGYSLLYEKVEYFEIEANMMGLTSEGQLRVWMHHNFAYNNPQLIKYSIIASSTKQNRINPEQSNMIHKILEIVQNHEETKGLFNSYFSKFKTNEFSFETIIDSLNRFTAWYNIPPIYRIDIAKKINLMI